MTFLDFLKSSRSVDPLLSQKSNYTLVIHGGAGTMSRETSTPAQREAYRLVLRRALRAGHAILSAGGEALDAATAAVTVMEGTFSYSSLRYTARGFIEVRFASIQCRQRSGVQ